MAFWGWKPMKDQSLLRLAWYAYQTPQRTMPSFRRKFSKNTVTQPQFMEGTKKKVVLPRHGLESSTACEYKLGAAARNGSKVID
jgi:hypothetical protein